MKSKTFKRLLDLLREKTQLASSEKTSVRGGLQEPQRMQGNPTLHERA